MNNVKRTFSGIALAVLLGSAGTVVGVFAQGTGLTPVQFKRLAISATTAEEHATVAAYYRAHAAEHIADARVHEEIVNASRNNPTDDQAWELGRAAAHYAEHSRESAEALLELAVLHDGMAARAAAKK